jgi:hypothetical protein
MSNSTTTTLQFSLTGVKIFWFACMAFLAITTVLGNILVGLVILKDRNLRTPSNILVINMGLGDMLFSLSSLPLSMIFLSFRETWSFGGYWNITFDAVWFGFTLQSFVNVIIIACERYIAVLRPFWYENNFTKTRATFCCSCVWLYIAALIFGLVIFTFKTSKETYSFLIPGYVYYPVLYFHAGIVFTLVPFLYHKIFVVAKQHKVRISRQCGWKKRKYYYLQMKATWTIGLVILLFVVVWLPFLIKQLLSIQDIFAGEWDIENSVISTFTYCNGAANFFVYSCRDTKIRRALAKMFLGKK